MRSRDLFDLGTEPRDYIVYPDDGCAFYFREDLCERLAEIGVEPDNDELERVFYPFLDPETQRVIEAFSHQGMSRRDRARLRERVERAEKTDFHMFDKRRMHYLRFVEMDQSRIHRAPAKIYRDLLDKSRDEIEQYFIEKEAILKPKEKKAYPYVIFDVASHFPGVWSRKMPQVLPQEEVDTCFTEALCRLNADASFWADLGTGEQLHEYLIRYVCWFFDSDFGESHYMEELMWEYMGRRRRYRPAVGKTRMAKEDALSVMGLSRESFAGMNVKRLTRHYRFIAQTRHPDKGGDHEGFIRLNRAYETLLSRVRADARPARYSAGSG
jgi:hypothetical protein